MSDVFWIEKDLGITTRLRGGDWPVDDLRRLKFAGVDALASCLTPEEEESLDLTQEAALADEVGTEFVRAMIDDRGIPSPGVIEQAVDQIVSARASSPGIGGGGNVRYTW